MTNNLETSVDRSIPAKILIVPGLHNSCPDHWQTWFETVLPNTQRVEQPDWEKTCLSDWAGEVRKTLDTQEENVWIVAHSFGCLASVTAGFERPDRILGALLVAPADPDRFNQPAVLLEETLPFPSLVIFSSNDPWVQRHVAIHWATIWGSDFVEIGEAGHINVDAGYGPWPAGLDFFEQLRCRVKG
jgi:uncharacterized protein